jgi:hypothetical protein
MLEPRLMKNQHRVTHRFSSYMALMIEFLEVEPSSF